MNAEQGFYQLGNKYRRHGYIQKNRNTEKPVYADKQMILSGPESGLLPGPFAGRIDLLAFGGIMSDGILIKCIAKAKRNNNQRSNGDYKEAGGLDQGLRCCY